MRLTVSPDKLILRETPGCLWLFGSFFISVSAVFVYGSLGGFTDYDRVPWWAIAASFLMGTIGISVGVWQIFLAPVTFIEIDRRRKTVVHRRRGLFGSKSDEYGFDQVKQFCAEQDLDDEGDPIWYLGLEFYGGKIVRITSMPSRTKEKDRDIAEKANHFLRT
jgi:hypothetical protein